jgi:hypothetical protein
VAPLTKSDPVIVKVKAGLPAAIELGFRFTRVGAGFGPLIEKDTEFDVPPSMPGLDTVTVAVPPCAISDAGIIAVSCPALSNVVVRNWPFHLTLEELVKLAPMTRSGNAGPPASPALGSSRVITGSAVDDPTTKSTELEVPPPGAGVKTLTEAVPGLCRSPAPIDAFSCPELIKVVVRDTPFHWTTELATKLVPLTVKVIPALPAVAEAGETFDTVGTGLGCAFIVNVTGFDVPPPGAGLKTVTFAEPAFCISAAVICAVNWFALLKPVVRGLPFH